MYLCSSFTLFSLAHRRVGSHLLSHVSVNKKTASLAATNVCSCLQSSSTLAILLGESGCPGTGISIWMPSTSYMTLITIIYRQQKFKSIWFKDKTVLTTAGHLAFRCGTIAVTLGTPTSLSM